VDWIENVQKKEGERFAILISINALLFCAEFDELEKNKKEGEIGGIKKEGLKKTGLDLTGSATPGQQKRGGEGNTFPGRKATKIKKKKRHEKQGKAETGKVNGNNNAYPF